MPKNKVSEWSSIAANNTDVGGIDVAEGCAPSGINNALREIMAQVKDMQAGTDGDNFTVGGNLSVTGTATGVTPSFGDNSTKLSTTAFVQAALAALHPIGSIYIAVISTNPATLFGFGTWVAFAVGKTLIGLDSSQIPFDVVEETGGSADAIVVSHTHTATDSGHTHVMSNNIARPVTGNAAAYAAIDGGVSSPSSTASGTANITVSTTGSSGTNANLPPYVVVYIWKRTA